LGVRGAGGVAEFVDRMRIGKIAQPDELADPLPPIQGAPHDLLKIVR
jgi:hypothetical protein